MSDNFDRLVEKGRRDFRIGMAILTETIIICCLVIIVFDPFYHIFRGLSALGIGAAPRSPVRGEES